MGKQPPLLTSIDVALIPFATWAGLRQGGETGKNVKPAAPQPDGDAVQLHIRFDHGLEGNFPLSLSKLVNEVAGHAGGLAVQKEEAVIIGQRPSRSQGKRMRHTGVGFQLLGQVRQLRGDICREEKGEASRHWPPSRPPNFTHLTCRVILWTGKRSKGASRKGFTSSFEADSMSGSNLTLTHGKV